MSNIFARWRTPPPENGVRQPLITKRVFREDFEGGGEDDDNFHRLESEDLTRAFSTNLRRRVETQVVHDKVANLTRKQIQEKMRAQFTKVFVYSQKTRGQFNWDYLYTFEPRSFTEKLTAIQQNLFELLYLLLIIAAASYQPSMISAGFIWLSHATFMHSSSKPVKGRLVWGKLFVYFNLAVWFVVVVWKARTINNMVTKYASEAEMKAEVVYLQSIGCDVSTSSEDWSVSVDTWSSFLFESIVLCIFLAMYSSFHRKQGVLAYLDKFKINLIMIKNYELSQIYESDDDQEEFRVGNSRDYKEKLLQQEQKDAYRKEMLKLRASMPINFTGCRYFYKFNKSLFLLIILFQLFQTMGFNGLFDIPQLFLILLMLAFYAFRKSYYVQFGKFIFFSAYYIHFALLLKLTLGILLKIDFVKHYMNRHDHSQFVKLVTVTFGQREPDPGESESDFQLQLHAYQLCLVMCISFCHAWKLTKEIDIQDRTKHLPPSTDFFTRLHTYLSQRESQKSRSEIIDKLQAARLKEKKKKIKRKEANKPVMESAQDDDLLRRAKKDLNKFLPTLVMWLLRIFLAFQAYMYHTTLSLFHLVFVLSTFVFPLRVNLFISITLMIPLYTFEFIMIYGRRIPVVKEQEFFVRYGRLFNWELQAPMLEQSLYFVILSLLFMTISCFKLTFEYDQNQYLISQLKQKIMSKTASSGWLFLFFVLRYIQQVVLIALFINGADNLNHFRNLGFMVFFVMFTAYEYLYRRTSFLLTIFVGFFIFGQYYYSLVYQKFSDSETINERLEWFNFYEENKKPHWKAEDSIYFRHTPYAFDWLVLILMSVLNLINVIFVNTKEANALTLLCYEGLRARYSKQVYFWVRFKNAFSSFFILFVLLSMFYFIVHAQTNCINWVFFTLNILNFAFIVKGDNKPSTIRHSHNIAQLIKIYGVLVLILDILFICFVGEKPKPDQPKSLDQHLARLYPTMYDNLDLVGFRVYERPGETLGSETRRSMLKFKFFSYIVYLMVSIYLSNLFKQRMSDAKGEEQFQEEDYKKLFEFKSVKLIEKENEQSIDEQIDRMRAEGVDDGNLQEKRAQLEKESKENRLRQNQFDEMSRFLKKKQYSELDLKDHFENVRFSTPFMVYKMMDYWPLFDSLATYGHIFNNFIIVVCAVYMRVSLYSCLNVFCVCIYYALATFKLNRRSHQYYDLAGLQSQTDLKIANMITKRFKIGAFYEFLRIRHVLWKVQFGALVLVSCLGFPSTLLALVRNKLILADKDAYASEIKTLDSVVFYGFLGGVYKDDTEVATWRFYYGIGLLGFGLVVERIAINWLTNRNGCNFNKLQKCIEIDLRHQCINEQWDVCPPKYCVDDYKNHYFKADFESLQEKFTESDAEANLKRKEALKVQKEIRDFVPYKVALRIRKFITFSVKLRGRASELQLDKATQKLLDHMDDERRRGVPSQIDQESIPLLRDYKIDFLGDIIMEAVNRKYKISFFKGMQLVLEALVLMILMVSVVLKANIFALIYLLVIFRYLTSESKTDLLVRMVSIMSVLFALQYCLYFLNMTDHTSPAAYPTQFSDYPKNKEAHDLSIPYLTPLFFKYNVFRDLRLAYLIGIGIEQDQLKNLILDFFNLYLVSMYILHYRNPLLVKSVHKIFWQFPALYDSKDKWNRLAPEVKKQVLFLYDPQPWTADKYREVSGSLSKQQKKLAEKQYQFAVEYNRDKEFDLNYVLINYVDLKYSEMWSEEFIRLKKWEFKEMSIFFRLVKQGSVLVYLSFHIIAILVILLMATLRQSFLSLGYVLIVLPRMKDGSEVLIQRNIHQDQTKNELEVEIEQLEEQLAQFTASASAQVQGENLLNRLQREEELEAQKEELTDRLRFLRTQWNKHQKSQSSKTHEQKQDEKKHQATRQWAMIDVFRYSLIIYAVADFTLQIIAQMPVVKYSEGLEIIGFRKVWGVDTESQLSYYNLINLSSDGSFEGFKIHFTNFLLQCMNCVMICVISLQIEIFRSPGYLKYVTQANGSMDLLIQLADQKAKSIAYCFNNHKIRKIVSIQRQKETIFATVDKLKEKLRRWRLFTRTTLDANQGLQKESHGTQTVDPEELELAGQTVGEASEVKEKKRVEFEDDEEQDFIDFDLLKRQRVSQEEADEIFDRLAKEVVKAKLEKLNFLSRHYLNIQNKYVQKIMFKNRPEALARIVQEHAAGEVFVPSELEQIMYEEAVELIKQRFGHKEGASELHALISRVRGRSGINLLKLTSLDKKIKLNQMRRTWDFTRTRSMVFKVLETYCYALISQTQNLIYLAMIFSMYMNAGLISLPYPVAVFGYALLEETRPRKEFWDYVRYYTVGILFFKFIMNLSVFGPLFDSEVFQFYLSLFKVGIYDYDDLGTLVLYMSPEILIVVFIMLNEIQLKLLGLYYQIEEDIETINEGIQRNIERGDQERVRQKKIQMAYMHMASFFEPLEEQKRLEELELKAIQEERRSLQIAPIEEEPLDLRAQQDKLLSKISGQIWKTSREFDIDGSSAANKKSAFDILVRDNVLQKTLESDTLVYLEGSPSNDIVVGEEVDRERALLEKDDNVSAADFEQDFSQKFFKIQERGKPELGIFENVPYFDKVFPSLKIQKPGYDLYGSTTSFLALLAIYVFIFWGQITVDQAELLDALKESNNIFKGSMAVCLITIITIMVVERYVNRCDTKAVEEKSLSDDRDSAAFFSQEEMFARTSTARSMTVKLKTMKTQDLDMQGSAAQDFLKTMYGDEGPGGSAFDDTRTKITKQQKTKFLMHWAILLTAHVFIFWVLPISGNYQLYGQPQCTSDASSLEKYGCKNFQMNFYLRLFYLICCVYFFLSALQIRYGFPIMKKPSSILQYNDDALALLGAQIYQAIPFATELRCLLDFTFSKTALDIFQFWQLFQYHIELYCAKNGNVSYVKKVLGSRTPTLDKCIFGVFITSIIMMMLVGPLLFFSDYGGFIAPNPAQEGDIKLAFIINKTISLEDLRRHNASEYQLLSEQFQLDPLDSLTSLAEVSGPEDTQSYTRKELKQQVPYLIFENKNPFFRQFDPEYYRETKFTKWTETRFFEADQLQECIANEYSDYQWQISMLNQKQLAQDILKAADSLNPDFQLQLGLYYSFKRDLPETARTASSVQFKTLNFSKQHDCETGQQLQKLAHFDCRKQENFGKNVTIRFTQAFYSNIILGSSTKIQPVVRQKVSANDQKHDVLLTYMCPGMWIVNESEEPTIIPESELPYLDVDPETCKPLKERSEAEAGWGDLAGDMATLNPDQQGTTFDKVVWHRVKFTLFSLMVSASIFASFNVTTFYTGVVLVLGSQLRPAFLYGTWRGWVYETTHPDAIVKLIEAIYIKRHEEDLVLEEEYYRMLQEIVRCPELLKAITGSTLKGSTDPILDKLSEEEREKLEHLDKLERKGFDVEKLKTQLLQSKQIEEF